MGRDRIGTFIAGLIGLGAASFLHACGEATLRTPTVKPTAAGCADDPTTAENTAAVVEATTTFLAALGPDGSAAARCERTIANAEAWAHGPGVKVGDLGSDARAALARLTAIAVGPAAEALSDEVRISVHGHPSKTRPWMLQLGGDRLAYNLTYNAKCTSATPRFDSGRNDVRHAALATMLRAVAMRPGAELEGVYDDMLNGPASPKRGAGGNDAKYPTGLLYPRAPTGRGVRVSTLPAAQKALVKTAIEAWVRDTAEPTAQSLLAIYESEEALAQTYVAYAGAADLRAPGSYARIDGPRLWIELTVPEDAGPEGRYRSIWRDKLSDYGGDFLPQ